VNLDGTGKFKQDIVGECMPVPLQGIIVAHRVLQRLAAAHMLLGLTHLSRDECAGTLSLLLLSGLAVVREAVPASHSATATHPGGPSSPPALLRHGGHQLEGCLPVWSSPCWALHSVYRRARSEHGPSLHRDRRFHQSATVCRLGTGDAAGKNIPVSLCVISPHNLIRQQHLSRTYPNTACFPRHLCRQSHWKVCA
jgi:hypothetical protein